MSKYTVIDSRGKRKQEEEATPALPQESFAEEFPVQNSVSFEPLFDRILVLERSQAGKIGNIFIPDSADPQMLEGSVISAGPGSRTEAGTFIPMTLVPGDIILFGKWAGSPIRLMGVDFLVLRESEVLGRVKK